MIKTLGGIVAGMAAAITIIIVMEGIGNQIAPPPARLDLTDLSETPPMPFLTSLFPVLGWFLGTLAGGFIAVRVSGQRWTAWAVAGAVLAATAVNFVLIAYPIWVIVVGVVVAPLGGWLAQRFSRPASAD